ncbi:DegT/DnrJ/EryC1/StrS family aminotransferase [Yinghuangia seranimata]|uniref:DegT/DnrJ/EryC1/StrS family aminotransferase n=1 Tax=Yinghuangia seranimata TaxID=408067 RepID=UPI00248A9CAA|nr:DegT/DnrJ/EryC1/StrS family aminotransferase [Yinghuangia seranimata]MDI2127380.1 DegT/DnrJ/EryC1/StrS family aminotransferase [Yinghuangia seranimata]
MAGKSGAAAAVPLGWPSLGAAELDAVAAVFRSGWVAGAGPACRAFEEEFARACGVGHAVAVANCTAGLHLALLAHGVGAGDEVIVADYTFPATGHAVLYTGATPVFADVRADTGTVDPDAVAALIGPRTVGIVAVDAAGLPADYAELGELAARHDLFLIEDAACAAGATYRGRPAGSLAPVAAFSFHGRKGITCGEGGAVVTDDAAFAAKVRKLAAFGLESAWNRAASTELPVPVFDEAGYNYKLSDIAAAIMRVQLTRLPELLAARARVAQGYAELLTGLDGVALPGVPDDRTTTWQSYLVTLDPGVDRGRVAAHLREQEIGCNFGTYASHVQPVYGARETCPVSADLFRRQLAVPMHAELSEADVERVAIALRKAVENSS